VIRQVTQDGEAWPIWSANTNEIYFRTRRDTAAPAEIHGIDVSTNGELAFRNPRSIRVPDVLMYQNYRDYDLTRAGDKLIVVVAEKKDGKTKPSVSRIDVVLNWIEELKERVNIP